MQDHELGLGLLHLQVVVTDLTQLLERLIDVTHTNTVVKAYKSHDSHMIVK